MNLSSLKALYTGILIKNAITLKYESKLMICAASTAETSRIRLDKGSYPCTVCT